MTFQGEDLKIALIAAVASESKVEKKKNPAVKTLSVCVLILGDLLTLRWECDGKRCQASLKALHQGE